MDVTVVQTADDGGTALGYQDGYVGALGDSDDDFSSLGAVFGTTLQVAAAATSGERNAQKGCESSSSAPQVAHAAKGTTAAKKAKAPPVVKPKKMPNTGQTPDRSLTKRGLPHSSPPRAGGVKAKMPKAKPKAKQSKAKAKTWEQRQKAARECQSAEKVLASTEVLVNHF